MVDKHPPWLTLPARDIAPLKEMERLLQDNHLHTVCESAQCPNQLECFSRHTCTFMILGDHCTRACRFCGVAHGSPEAVDPGEPMRVADAARSLDLRYAVVTSVTRDDLPDGGARHFQATVQVLQELPGLRVELLVPDFGGDAHALDQVIEAEPDVVGHNVETVPRLYSRVRPGADYERSLNLMARVSASASVSKSGLMVGLGETLEEVIDVMRDLRAVGCEILTIGQYLQPHDGCLPVERYVRPDSFLMLEEKAARLGFKAYAAGPLVRSSYRAEQVSRLSRASKALSSVRTRLSTRMTARGE